MKNLWNQQSMRSAAGVAILALIAMPAMAQTTLQRPTSPTNANQNNQASPAAPGQRPQASTQPGANATGQQAGQQAGGLDQQIAACMVLGNQEEVALAQLAQERAQHAEVKKFAQQMVEHHQQAISKIEQAAPQVASMQLQLGGSAAGAQPGADRANADQAAQPQTSAGNQQQAIHLLKAVKQECLQLTEKEMTSLQGAEFDKAFMGQQVAAHIGMLAQLRGSRDFASAPLQRVIAEGEQVTQQHLDQAKQIMEQIKDQGSNQQTTQRPAATNQPVR